MLSSQITKGDRIEFPDKDPDGWISFYEFISPQRLGELNYHADREINSNNVSKLLPWFSEFHMNEHVRECDKYLARTYHMLPFYGNDPSRLHGNNDYSDSFWNKEKQGNESDNIQK